MRPTRWLRKMRPVHAAAGVVMLVTPASAVALTVAPTETKSAAQVQDTNGGLQIQVQMNVRTRHVAFGHDLIVTGTASRPAAGSKLLLEFLQVGDQHWRTLRTGTVARDGQFRLAAPVRESGHVRITVVRPASASADHTAATASARTAPAAGDGELGTADPHGLDRRPRRYAVQGVGQDRAGRQRPAGRASRSRRRNLPYPRQRHHERARTVHDHPRVERPRLAVAARALQRRPPEHAVVGRRRSAQRLPAGGCILVRRRRRHGVRLPRLLRRGQQDPAVRHPGHVPPGRALGHGHGR